MRVTRTRDGPRGLYTVEPFVFMPDSSQGLAELTAALNCERRSRSYACQIRRRAPHHPFCPRSCRQPASASAMYLLARPGPARIRTPRPAVSSRRAARCRAIGQRRRSTAARCASDLPRSGVLGMPCNFPQPADCWSNSACNRSGRPAVGSMATGGRSGLPDVARQRTVAAQDGQGSVRLMELAHRLKPARSAHTIESGATHAAQA